MVDKTTTVLISKLRGFYTDAEAFNWLTLPQPLLHGKVPIEMIACGETETVVNALRQIEDSVYL